MNHRATRLRLYNTDVHSGPSTSRCYWLRLEMNSHFFSLAYFFRNTIKSQTQKPSKIQKNGEKRRRWEEAHVSNENIQTITAIKGKQWLKALSKTFSGQVCHTPQQGQDAPLSPQPRELHSSRQSLRRRTRCVPHVRSQHAPEAKRCTSNAAS